MFLPFFLLLSFTFVCMPFGITDIASDLQKFASLMREFKTERSRWKGRFLMFAAGFAKDKKKLSLIPGRWIG